MAIDPNVKEARKVRKHLVDITTAVRAYLATLDATMKLPDSNERGKAIAKLSNSLELANDQARYFGLGIDYRKDKR